MTKVSILIAVYNASKYLDNCINSVLNQTLSNIQIICIDDCSTDNSLSILNEYAKKDSRINVIHLNENSGQAHARNVGLEIAEGQYICMLDADDWYSPNTLELAVDTFEEHPTTDCVLLDVEMVFDDHKYMYPMPSFEYIDGTKAMELSLTWQIHGLYLIRSELHKRYPYDETCKLYSDDNTTRIHYAVSRQVRHCKGIYHYRQHSQSLTHATSVLRFDYLKANESLRQQLISIGSSQQIITEFENYRWLILIDVYMFYHCHGNELSKSEKELGINEIKRIWNNIDRSMLYKHTTSKFGYYPMAKWWQFRVQEWLYFTIRDFLGKNK